MEQFDSNRALEVIDPYQSKISLKSGSRETEDDRISKIPGNPSSYAMPIPV